MTSAISWLDFDARQQRVMQAVLDALSEPSTIDDLGLGVVRDAVSHWLHPGLSVQHTRARYMLFIPWTYRHLQGSTAAELAVRGRRAEERIRDALVQRYGTSGAEGVGVIGRRSGDQLGRLPSLQYWGLLRHLGILTLDSSPDDYCGAVASRRAAASSVSRLHSEDDVMSSDEPYWSEMPPTPDGFPGALDFDLLRDEALFLRERADANHDADHSTVGLCRAERGLPWTDRQPPTDET